MKHCGRPLFFLVIVLAFLCAVSSFIFAGCGEETEQKKIELRDPSMEPVEDIPDDRQLTFDDVLYTEYVSEMAFSPDGSLLAWCKDFCEPGMMTRANNVFLTDLVDYTTVQLTSFEGAMIGGLKWSPDGARIAFLSDAVPSNAADETAGAIQVWAVGPGGQDAAPLTSAQGGVEEYGWRDGQTLLYTTPVERPGEEMEPGDSTVHVSELCDAPVCLFQLDLAGGEAAQVTRNDDRIMALSVSPDGRYAFYVRTQYKGFMPGHTYYADSSFHNYLLDLESGEEIQVFKEMRSTGGEAWSGDSETLYAVDLYYEENPYAFRAEALALDVSTGEECRIDLGWPRGMEMMSPFGLPNSPIRPTPDGFLAFLADGCNPRLARYTRSGESWEMAILEGEHQGNIFYAEVSPNGETVCYDHSNASQPPQVYAASLKGGEIVAPEAITALNPAFEERDFARSETITWEGSLGDPIEGVLFYPEGYESGNRYPLMLVIHGGPWECDKDRWQSYHWIDPYHILSQKGAFVLAPNYHGSTGYGENSIDFASSIQDGEFYGLVIEDIENGMERLIELGMVDENLLGTMGWSCGSIISNALIVHDQRFKVASCGAGGAEWVSEWGGSMFGDTFIETLFGSDPVENPDLFKDPAQAPFYDAARVETPVIMFQPAADVNVAPGMTWITYRGIQKHGSAPVELYIFPGEGHVPMLVPHQRRKMVEEQKWFDEYLFD
ncbi:MAG: S9 family peptidase [Actinobacteria bacterium]|nr:S9 family peptidase [Actinomycetota bacterium]